VWGLKIGTGLVATAYSLIIAASVGVITWDVLVTGSYKVNEVQMTCKTMYTHPLVVPTMWWVAFLTCYFSSAVSF
jgi:hypothetical protein